MATTTLDFSKPHVLRGEAELNAAIAEIDVLLDLDPPPESEEYDRLNFLSVLVKEFEDREYPIARSTPQEMIDFMLDQKGKSRADLAPAMGGRSRVSDFFQGNRRLPMGQAIALRDLLGIPADLLIGSTGTGS